MNQFWTLDEDNLLKENYLKCSEQELVKLLPNRTWQVIVNHASKLKIGSRRKAGLVRKYTFDFDYFNQIDTQEKAYWLGFIYADGSVNQGRLAISLVVEGKNHLEKFKKSINYTGPILGPYYASSKTKSGEKTKYSIECHHTGFVKDLMKHGVIPNKTFFVSFPKIPKNLRRHFIRGLFDGDGSISVGTTKYKEKVYTRPSFSICGAVPKFLEDVVDVFVEEVGVTRNVVVDRSHEKYDKNIKNSTASLFGYTGTPALRIRDWLYDGATVYMQCKKDKFYSWDYSLIRPQDKEHQNQIIDEQLVNFGIKRISDYKGYYEDMTFQCEKGHVWTTKCLSIKLGHGCKQCADLRVGERETQIGKDNLDRIFSNRGWKLLSEYSSDGRIRILCEHGKEFTMTRRSSIRPHAQCDCIKTNSLNAGKKTLVSKLVSKGWKLISDYKGSEEYVVIECQHGKQFSRLPLNVRKCSKCDCDKLTTSGYKGIYKQPNGKYAACVQKPGSGKQKRLGTFSSIEEALNCQKAFLEM